MTHSGRDSTYSRTSSINPSTLFIMLTLLLTVVASGCGGGTESDGGLSGDVRIDGSSTVFPVTEAVAEEFMITHPDVRVTVGISGTGGGFQKFAGGETDIQNASRPIKESEAARAGENGIEPIEMPVAFDGLTVVVHPENDWVDSLTVEELKEIWKPGSMIDTWNDIRPEWPNQEIHLYGPGTDSGTFDYFTEAIVGEEDASRPDYTASEDDNVLVTGVSNDNFALGYFGFAYYIENKDQLKAVPIDNGDGPVTPAEETIEDGSYTPLSRPLLIYVSRASLKRPEVKAFAEFYMIQGPDLVADVGYVKMPQEEYDANLEKIR